jgi:hypothetical protein
MSISVTKQGPYFTSGSISFSQLRSTFKETGSGSISASEYRRNTDRNERNPIVPDSTENENISTGSNLSLSQFRNSVKRYYATQSGTDHNLGNSGEPGLRMGRVKPDGSGIDWSGGGTSGRDREGSSDGNYTRNIQKFINITGTCGSYYTNQPAAQLAPGVPVYNTSFTISGQIYGAGGIGGVSGDGNGKDGGPAVNIQYDQGGNVSPVNIESSARIWAGGGGGEKGRNGDDGLQGACSSTYTTRNCGPAPACNSGDQDLGVRDDGCCRQRYTLGIKNGCDKWRLRTCRRLEPSTVPTGGLGGDGGRGQGYDGGWSFGSSGQSGTCPTCSSGTALGPTYGTCGTNGGTGGRGGDWASDGEETAAVWRRGYAGKAFLGSYYALTGSLNGETIKGAYNA